MMYSGAITIKRETQPIMLWCGSIRYAASALRTVRTVRTTRKTMTKEGAPRQYQQQHQHHAAARYNTLAGTIMAAAAYGVAA